MNPASANGARTSAEPRARTKPTDARLREHVKELRRRGVYLTGPRRSVLEIVCRLQGHLTMVDIMAEVRVEAPLVSIATVYRTMRLLVDAELVQERRFKGRAVWFEMDRGRGDRDQLVCKGCGKVVEFEDETFSVLRRQIAVERGFDLALEPCTLLGTCPGCAERSASRPCLVRGRRQRCPGLAPASIEPPSGKRSDVGRQAGSDTRR